MAHHGGQNKSHKLENGLLIALGVVVALVTVVTLGNLALDEWNDKSKASSDSTTAVRTTPPSAEATAVTTTPPGYISEATWTDGPWPFTVTEGVLMCTNWGPLPKQVTFTANYVMHGLNATARLGGYADPTAIVRDNPAIPGTKADVRPVIQRGLKVCGQ